MPPPDVPGGALAALGFDSDRREELDSLERSGVAGRGAGLRPGRCIRVDRGSAVVLTDTDQVRVDTDGSLATGDWLALSGSRLIAVLDRRGEIARRRAGPIGGRQIIAANVDVLGIVCGLDRPVKAGRIQRAVALARAGGAEPYVVLTKSDLHEDSAALAAALTSALATSAICVSAGDGSGLDELAALAAPSRTLAVIGESGAGKSTLTNALSAGGLATGEVRAGDAKGRHTTTARELIPLPGGGAIIDTPGLREVGVLDPAGVDAAFADVLDVAGACQFRDCRHEIEPGCAVRAAASSGLVDPDAVERMLAMRREAEAAELRAHEHDRRQSEKRFARVAREAQAHRRGRRRDR